MNNDVRIGDEAVLFGHKAPSKTPAVTHDKAMHILGAAKSDYTTMMKLRVLLLVPEGKMTDDQLLEVVADDVVNRKMVLRLCGSCTENKRRFFNWLAQPLARMAQDLNTTQRIMLTLAAKEGGWDKSSLDHNEALNNPFGVNHIKGGRAVGNVDYGKDGLPKAIADWESGHSYVNGITDGSKFVQTLLDHHYNTVKPHYADEYMGLYDDVYCAIISCKVVR